MINEIQPKMNFKILSNAPLIYVNSGDFCHMWIHYLQWKEPADIGQLLLLLFIL